VVPKSRKWFGSPRYFFWPEVCPARTLRPL